MLTCCLLLLMFEKSSYFVELRADAVADELVLDYQLDEFLIPSGGSEKDRQIANDFSRAMLLGQVQQSIPLVQSMEALRQRLFNKEDQENFPLLKYSFLLEILTLKGEVLHSFPFRAFVFMSPQEGMTGLASLEKGERLTPTASLSDPQAARAWMRSFLDPISRFRCKLPNDQAFLVQLTCDAPLVHPRLDRLKAPGICLSPYFRYRFNQEPRWMTLGSAYCRKDPKGLSSFSSPHLRFRDQANRRREQLVRQGEEAHPDQLQEYLQQVPSDPQIRALLFLRWWQAGKKFLAWDLANRYHQFIHEPLVSKFLDSFEQDRARSMKRIQDDRSGFKIHPTRQILFDNPTQDQVLGGRDLLKFHFSENESRLLRAEIFLNNQFMAQIQHPPYQFSLLYPDEPRKQKLRIAAYFEDETYSENSIDVEILPVDTQETVELRQLRAVVVDSKGRFNTLLDRSHFLLKIQNQPRALRECRLDQKPLRIALLLDSSESMSGAKKYRAQAAAHALIKQLESEDTASLFTFDRQVFQLSDFKNDHRMLPPLLYTLHPLMDTRLYDAIFLAHQALLGQDGTRVILLVSDGMDSDSRLSEAALKTLLADSSVMLYSVVIDESEKQDPQAVKGQAVLKSLAELTGSSVHLVKDTRNLETTFAHIYRELKSFYYLDYFGLSQDPATLELSARKPGHKLRWHRLRE